MDENLVEKLFLNIKELENINESIATCELAIYQKNLDAIKEEKTKELNKFLKYEAKGFDQKIEDHEVMIYKILQRNNTELDKLFNVYDEFFISVLRMMENAILNQNITIVNIVNIKKKIEVPGKTAEEYSELYKILIANVQKKLNYSSIIEECLERFKWIIRNVRHDANKVFIYEYLGKPAIQDNAFEKIVKRLNNRLSGKRRYNSVLKSFYYIKMKKIMKKNKKKIIHAYAVSKGVRKQLEVTKDKITMEYNNNI